MPKGDFLGEFEMYVLLALAHLGREAYGMTIRQEIARRTGRDTAIGTVYATLSRLEEKGFVAYDLSDPLPVPGGRARKQFTLTSAGERALAHSTRTLASMMRGWRPRTQHE
jgi:PadR family transcriptional regulator, regulatory protein PadR